MGAGFLIFGALAVHGPFGASAIEAGLEAAAREQLRTGGIDWASAEANGRRIVLNGSAPDRAALGDVIDLIATINSADTPIARAIAGVDTTGVVILAEDKLIDDYRFSARIDGDRLSISGGVPDATTREALLAPFLKTSALKISDDTEIAPLSAKAVWADAARAGLAALAILGDGALVIDGFKVSISGVADDGAVADAAESMIAGGPAGFDYVVAIDRRDLPGLASEDKAQSRSLCQSAINRSVNGRKLTFAANSDQLDADERAMLDTFAMEIRACAGLKIAIEGHTDSTGGAAYNLQLSERRGYAVKRYLETRTNESVFETRAFGETRPIASNSTNAGRQRNRRIDFVVIDAEIQNEGANAP